MGAADVSFGVLLWYGGSVLGNVWTQRLLREGFRFPLATAVLGLLAQLFVLLWVARVRAAAAAAADAARAPQPGVRPRGTASVGALLPLSLCQIGANYFHRAALMRCTIPVVHTVKSLTAVATAGLAFAATGARPPSLPAVLTMVAGVAYAMLYGLDAKTGDLDLWAASPAFVCVAADSVRSVYGKTRLMGEQVDPTLSLIKLQLVSLSLLVPFAVWVEGARLAALLTEEDAVQRLPLASMALSTAGFASMELGSFFCLSRLTSLTHAMSNGLRSLVLIGAGVAFGAPVRYAQRSCCCFSHTLRVLCFFSFSCAISFSPIAGGSLLLEAPCLWPGYFTIPTLDIAVHWRSRRLSSK